MKRTAQMVRAGVPKAGGNAKKFKGFRKDWKAGPVYDPHPIRTLRAFIKENKFVPRHADALIARVFGHSTAIKLRG